MPADLEWYEIVLRLAVGALLGGVVGLERESAGQDAGFRTHLLLALGTAMFGVISVGAWDSFIEDRASTNVNVDVTRVASYVAAGVGFIGGGAIVKQSHAVRGITTAASIWVAAAIGLGAGLGLWVAVVTGAVLAVAALSLLKPVSTWLARRSTTPRSMVITVARFGATSGVVRVLEEPGLPSLRAVQIARDTDEGDAARVEVQFWSWPDTSTLEHLRAQLVEELGSDLSSIDEER
jgi:putative Mg2+ transporter-C (MgtC) family protein